MKTSDLLKGVVTLDEYLAERLSEKKPMTNADRIRAMSDEQLARVFTDDLCELLCHSPCTCDAECESHMLKWLRQESADKDSAE